MLFRSNELYLKGIREACAFYGVAESDIDTYVTGLPELTTMTQEKALYEIHMQQWIDLMDRPFEEFVGKFFGLHISVQANDNPSFNRTFGCETST